MVLVGTFTLLATFSNIEISNMNLFVRTFVCVSDNFFSKVWSLTIENLLVGYLENYYRWELQIWPADSE